MGRQVVFVMTATETGNMTYSRIGVFKSFPTSQQACEIVLGVSEMELLNEYLNPAHRAMNRMGLKQDVYVGWYVQEKNQTVTIHCQEVK